MSKYDFLKILSYYLSCLVKTEYFSEWQAGFVFGYIMSDISYVFPCESEVKNVKNEKNA